MARILIVGCGCRGQELAAALIDDGHLVRGTTRHPDRLDEIEAACGHAALADPDRLGNLLPLLGEGSVVCWLLGTAPRAPGANAALPGPRHPFLLAEPGGTP